jgi:arginyl-tRNA synthetase
MASSGKTSIYELPYPLTTDIVDVAGDIKLLANKLDISIDDITQSVVGSMVSGNVEAGISVTHNAAAGTLNFILDDNYIKDTVAPIIAHDDHLGITAVYNTVTNKVILEVTGGGGSGGTSSASLSDMWWLSA